MSNCHTGRCLIIFTMFFLLTVPAVSGWTMESWSVVPSGTELLPGTQVEAEYSMYFDSWMTGTTFEPDNTLTMFTELEDPAWTVEKVETLEEQEPIVETIPVRQSKQVGLDGWTLSYSSKRFTVVVGLSGTVPERAQTSTVTILRLQELDPDAKTVPGTLIKKEVQVIVPTTVATTVTTPAVTVNLTPSEFIEITPEAQAVTPAAVAPAKTTYSPGPDAVLILGTLAALALAAGQKMPRDR